MSFESLRQLRRSGPHVPAQTYTPVLTPVASSTFSLLCPHRVFFSASFFTILRLISYDLRPFPYLTNKKQFSAYALNCFTFAWQRPTLTGGDPPTTIGAEELNFRVRRWRPMSFESLRQLRRSGPHVPAQTYTPVLTPVASSTFSLLCPHRVFFSSSIFYYPRLIPYDLRPFPYRTKKKSGRRLFSGVQTGLFW